MTIGVLYDCQVHMSAFFMTAGSICEEPEEARISESTTYSKYTASIPEEAKSKLAPGLYIYKQTGSTDRGEGRHGPAGVAVDRDVHEGYVLGHLPQHHPRHGASRRVHEPVVRGRHAEVDVEPDEVGGAWHNHNKQ